MTRLPCCRRPRPGSLFERTISRQRTPRAHVRAGHSRLRTPAQIITFSIIFNMLQLNASGPQTRHGPCETQSYTTDREMSMRHVGQWITAAVLALFVGACDDVDNFSRELGEPCAEDLDCVSYYLCVGGSCSDGSSGGGASPRDTGGGCSEAGQGCASSACCDGSTCVTDSWTCSSRCSSSNTCVSGCCARLNGGGGACHPQVNGAQCL